MPIALDISSEHLRTLRYSCDRLYTAKYRDEPELCSILTITHNCTCSDLHTMLYHREGMVRLALRSATQNKKFKIPLGLASSSSS